MLALSASADPGIDVEVYAASAARSSPKRLEARRDAVPHRLRIAHRLHPLELLERRGMSPRLLVGERLGEKLPRGAQLRFRLAPRGGDELESAMGMCASPPRERGKGARDSQDEPRDPPLGQPSHQVVTLLV